MANLVVTNACNLECPFCFASEYRCEASGRAVFTSLAELDRQLALTDDKEARFCGGEPTLHPDFLKMLRVALSERKRSVLLMTNGLWPPAVGQAFRTLRRRYERRVTFLVNLLEPHLYTAAQRERLHETLQRVDPGRTTLSVTLYHRDFDFSHALEMAKAYGIAHVRYSIAAPSVTDPRTWLLDPERDFPALASSVYRFVTKARARGLYVHSDCGYLPPCMFTEAQLAELTRDSNQRARMPFECNGPLDIGPTGEAWRCFGLFSIVRTNRAAFRSARELHDELSRRTRVLDRCLLYERCETCRLRGDGCGGGCYAFRAVQRLRELGAEAGVAADDDEALIDAVPEVLGDRLRLWQRGDEQLVMYDDGDGWAELDAGPLGQLVLVELGRGRSARSIAGQITLEHPEVDARAALARALRHFWVLGGITLR